MVYGQLPKYLINRFQQVQNTTAGYVYGWYAKMLDVINLNWIPIEENIEMKNVKLAHKSLINELWPNGLKFTLIERKRTLRSSHLGPIIKQGDDYTFYQHVTVYNNLLTDFKEINAFSRKRLMLNAFSRAFQEINAFSRAFIRARLLPES